MKQIPNSGNNSVYIGMGGMVKNPCLQSQIYPGHSSLYNVMSRMVKQQQLYRLWFCLVLFCLVYVYKQQTSQNWKYKKKPSFYIWDLIEIIKSLQKTMSLKVSPWGPSLKGGPPRRDFQTQKSLLGGPCSPPLTARHRYLSEICSFNWKDWKRKSSMCRVYLCLECNAKRRIAFCIFAFSHTIQRMAGGHLLLLTGRYIDWFFIVESCIMPNAQIIIINHLKQL